MSPITRTLVLAAAAAVAAALAATPSLAATPRQQRAPVVQDTCADCVPGEILVQFRSGASAADRSSALGIAGGLQLQSLRAPSISMAKSFAPASELVRARVTLPVAQAIERLRRDPAVELAEPVFRIHASAVGNDTYYQNGTQWSAYSPDSPAVNGPVGTTNAFGSQSEAAWAREVTGRGDVYVGVLDEGVAHLHPELDQIAWRNPYELADGRDNDGNGYSDDLYGWDFVGASRHLRRPGRCRPRRR